ncbi:IRK-interacting protein [Cinnamomum micranthum f. kanehirae]|uniref:IRK-interacting protein n=1 Tax=Cinnamomum micranthum f. kanehirae TaxID=337451 RepID=A0A443Q317_9MAGN|nr:IRK-interacting protein [Cinnamomum micranthum f. kanehirae]
MDSAKPPTTNVGGLFHAVTKVLKLRRSGVVPDDGIRKLQSPDNTIDPPQKLFHLFNDDSDEKLRTRAAMQVLLAKLFASISAIKAAYAQLQIAQSPYDPDCIHSADEIVVAELKSVSELKHCYFKKQILDLPSQDSQLSAEAREQKNLLKTYEIMMKKLQSQLQLKDSEILFLNEKLQESDKQKRMVERKLKPHKSSSLSSLDNLHLSGLNPTHFITVYNQTLKSIRSFVKLMIDQMESARWDINAAADSIQPNVRKSQKSVAFESYVCKKMFAGFQEPDFAVSGLGSARARRSEYFKWFMDLKSRSAMEIVGREKKRLGFGEFCRLKYLSVVHPKMEAAFFGDVRQRNAVSGGWGFPATAFFEGFAEMARRVWVLHCLGFSFEKEAEIFQVRQGCRFSDVYMEECCPPAVDEEEAAHGDADLAPLVGFTVVPGFIVGKTVVQCKVYISPAPVQL